MLIDEKSRLKGTDIEFAQNIILFLMFLFYEQNLFNVQSYYCVKGSNPYLNICLAAHANFTTKMIWWMNFAECRNFVFSSKKYYYFFCDYSLGYIKWQSVPYKVKPHTFVNPLWLQQMHKNRLLTEKHKESTQIKFCQNNFHC